MKSVPVMTTDKEAEGFLDQDLSDLDFTQFKKIDWETKPKTARVNMRLPEGLIAAVKARATQRGVPLPTPDPRGTGAGNAKERGMKDHGRSVFEGDGHVEWFEGSFEAYEKDKVRRLGPESSEPKRVKYKWFSR